MINRPEQQTLDLKNFKVRLNEILLKCPFSDSVLGKSLYAGSNKVRRPSEEVIDNIVSALSQYPDHRYMREIIGMVRSNFYAVQELTSSSELKKAEMEEILVRVILKLLPGKTKTQPALPSEIGDVNEQVTNEWRGIL